MSEKQKPLMLYTSTWRDQPTFKMLPVTTDSPFLETIYDPISKSLVVILKFVKNTLTFVPKVNKDGDVHMLTKPRQRGQRYAEERIGIETLPEYYIEKREEQEEFIKMLTTNHSTFDYKAFLDAPAVVDNTMEPVVEQ